MMASGASRVSPVIPVSKALREWMSWALLATKASKAHSRPPTFSPPCLHLSMSACPYDSSLHRLSLYGGAIHKIGISCLHWIGIRLGSSRTTYSADFIFFLQRRLVRPSSSTVLRHITEYWHTEKLRHYSLLQ
jgi:hypothetical protein